MVPPSSHRVPRVRRYSGSCRGISLFGYMTLTSSGRPSHAARLQFRVLVSVLTPKSFLIPVWPPPISLATTLGISFDFFSSPYLDVSVREVPLITLFYSGNNL